MKSAILENGKISIIDVKKPALTAPGAIIKVLACGLCGSDIVKIHHGAENPNKKVILGHEVVGEIAEINTNIIGNSYYKDNKEPFKVGDIVALGHHYPCMECDYCKSGHHSMCETFKAVNISPAGFSEYIYISEGHLKNTVFKLKNGLSIENATFTEPLSCCIRAIRQSGYIYPGNKNIENKPPAAISSCLSIENPCCTLKNSNALVIGLGSIGLLMSLGLKAFNVNNFGLDINPERQSFAEKFGIKFDENIHYDTIFMTSGSYKAIDTALKYIKNGGKIVVFSSVEGDFGYKNNEIYYRELTVLGSYSPAPVDLALSFELLSQGIIDLSGVSAFYTLDNLPQAVNDTMLNRVFKACIKL